MLSNFGRQLAGDSVVYGLAGAAQQVILLILLPVYARALGPSGLGVVGVFQATTSLALVVVGLAWPQAFLRWYLRERPSDRGAVVGTTLGVRAVASVVGAALVVPAGVAVAAVLYDGEHSIAFAMVAPIVVIDAVGLVALTYLRAERRSKTYLVLSLSRGALAGLFIVSLLLLERSVLAVAAGQLGGVAIASIAGLAILVREAPRPIRIETPLAIEMLRFAAPLIPAAAGIWALHLIDRPLLQGLTGSAEAVGIYTLGYAGGLIINATVVGPFATAWGAAHWSLEGEAAARGYAQTMATYATAAVGLAVALSCFGTDAIRLLAGSDFEESRYIVPFSAFGYVLYGLHHIASTGLNVTARTHLVTVGVGVSAGISIGLTLVLVPLVGIYGAAVATVAGFLTLAIATGTLSQRHLPVPWPVKRVGLAIAIGAALSAAAVVGPDLPVWRMLCAVAYIPVAWWLLRDGR